MKRSLKGMVALLAAMCLLICVHGQTLEIHQINVGQGDATLIVLRNVVALELKLTAAGIAVPAANLKYNMAIEAVKAGANLAGTVNYAVLIDAGLGSVQGTKIYNYMQKIGVTKVDMMALSHFHGDHYGGFKTLMTTYNVLPDFAYHRGGLDRFPKPSAGSRAGYTTILTREGKPLNAADPNATVIRLGTPANNDIKLTCTASNGRVLRDLDPANRVASNDENNYSTSWVLQYKSFRFYTGGDLNGMEFTRGDLETPMIDNMIAHDGATFIDHATDAAIRPGHICAFKLNHHGGQESTNDYFLAMMQPKVALLSCGYSRSYYHPKIEVLKSLDASYVANWNTTDYVDASHPGLPTSFPNTIVNYYLTNLMDGRDPKMQTADYNGLYTQIGTAATNGIIGGDIMVVVDDNDIATESKFAVYWNGLVPPAGVVTGPLRAHTAAGTNYYRCHKSADATHVQYILNH
jgi:competence protein ComEC